MTSVCFRTAGLNARKRDDPDMQKIKKVINQMDKRGVVGAGIWILIVLMMVVGGYAVYYMSQQTAITAAEEAAREEGVIPTPTGGLTCGKTATIKTYVYNIPPGANSKTAVNAPIYLYEGEKGAGKNLKIRGTETSSTTASTSLATSVCKYVDLVSFNRTWHPIIQRDLFIDSQTEYFDIETYEIRNVTSDGELKVTPYVDNSGDSRSFAKGNMNLSLAADQVNTFHHIEIEQNVSNKVFALSVIGWEMNVTSSEIDDIDMASGEYTAHYYGGGTSTRTGTATISEYDTVIHRLRNVIDFAFIIDTDSAAAGDQPALLFEFDTLDTGKITFTATGTGCPSQGSGGETMNLHLLDEGGYIGNLDDVFYLGVEDDSSSHYDVGGSDSTLKSMNCNAA